MVWPIAPDRLSPSGPILPTAAGGAIIQIGSDTLLEPQVIEDTLPFFVLRDQSAPMPSPLSVTLQGYTTGNPVLVMFSLGATFSFADEASLLSEQFVPVVQIGADAFLVNNAVQTDVYHPDDEVFPGIAQHTRSHSILFTPDPAIMTTDPVVGMLGQISTDLEPVLYQLGGGRDGDDPLAPYSTWLIVAELDAQAVPQTGPTNLVLL